MKKHLRLLLLLSLSSLLWQQAAAQTIDEIDMSEVVVIEDVEPAPIDSDAGDTEVVVEIPGVEVEGASLDVEAPVIPAATEALPDETEIVLEIPGQEPQSAGAATMASEETISVDFPDEEARTILRNVADLFELNLVIPDTLQGRTSIKLRNVSWSQVFEEVLRQFRFTYVEDRNIIRVISIDELTTEPVDTRVFVVNFARAGDIQGSIAPLVDSAAGGQIKVDVRSNALVITERPSRMNKIQEIIDRLDKPTAQVMIETKFIEVTNSDIKNIGVDWASLSGYEVSAGPFQRDWNRSREAGSSGSVNSGQTAGTTSDTSSGSITSNGNTTTSPRVVSNTENVNSTFDSLANLTSSASTGRFDTAVFSAQQFRVVLSALKTVNDSKLVANPTVVTMDNQLARIDIVREVPQIEFNFNPETGTREAQGLAEPLSFGTKIEVTPQVNDAGFINLKVVPEVSNQVGIQETQLGPQPIIDVRKAETNVVIKDGFTLAIGGLSQNEETKSGSRVPLLGSLPGVGKLFRSDTDDITQRNLIIFITAKTLNPDGTDYRDIVDPRILDDMGIVPSELPGYDITAAERKQLRRLEQIRMEENEAERSAKANAIIKQYEEKTNQLDSDSE
jgi:type IV pilus assembly protein PilQ